MDHTHGDYLEVVDRLVQLLHLSLLLLQLLDFVAQRSLPLRHLFGFWVLGLGFGVWDLGFWVWGLGFGVWGLWFGVWGLGFGVWGLGFGVRDLRV